MNTILHAGVVSLLNSRFNARLLNVVPSFHIAALNGYVEVPDPCFIYRIAQLFQSQYFDFRFIAFPFTPMVVLMLHCIHIQFPRANFRNVGFSWVIDPAVMGMGRKWPRIHKEGVGVEEV